MQTVGEKWQKTWYTYCTQLMSAVKLGYFHIEVGDHVVRLCTMSQKPQSTSIKQNGKHF